MWALALLHLANCSGPPPPDPAPDPAPAPRRACRPWLDVPIARELTKNPDELGLLRVALGPTEPSLDGILRVVFPEAAGKIRVEEALELEAAVYSVHGFPDFEITAPIDWTADPHGNNSWRLFFQDLHWITELPTRSAAYVLTSWAEQVLPLDSPLDYTWYDAAVAQRLDSAVEFIDRYLADGGPFDPRVLLATAKILLTHRAVLAEPDCYTSWSNHGLMQDIALLRQALRFEHLPGAARLGELAERRLVTHQVAAVADDGVHIENSPGYHLFFTGLLLDVIDVYGAHGKRPPEAILRARDRLIATLPDFVQPNQTFPQFGDTANGPLGAELQRLLERVSAQEARGIRSPPTHHLEAVSFLASAGRHGAPPAELDRVFPTTGYASFRSSWAVGEDSEAIVAHFKCARLTDVHAHDDETSFELFGFGRELIVDAGHHNFERSDPRTRFQYLPEAHNLLAVDDAPFQIRRPARLQAFALGHEYSWVRGGHDYYAHLGVQTVSRTFAYHRPNQFLVLDAVRAEGPHRYRQGFNLHPDLDEVQFVSERHLVARGSDGRGPALVFTVIGEAFHVRVEDTVYFPDRNVVLKNYRVSFERATLSGGSLVLPVLISLVAPGTTPLLPSEARIVETDGLWEVLWEVAGKSFSAVVPRGDAG